MPVLHWMVPLLGRGILLREKAGGSWLKAALRQFSSCNRAEGNWAQHPLLSSGVSRLGGLGKSQLILRSQAEEFEHQPRFFLLLWTGYVVIVQTWGSEPNCDNSYMVLQTLLPFWLEA